MSESSDKLVSLVAVHKMNAGGCNVVMDCLDFWECWRDLKQDDDVKNGHCGTHPQNVSATQVRRKSKYYYYCPGLAMGAATAAAPAASAPQVPSPASFPLPQ